MSLDAEVKNLLKWVDGKAGSSTASCSTMNDLHAALKDGQVLIKLMNALKPGCIKKANKAKMPFMMMENIGFVVDAVRAYGIVDEYNFVTVDLFENQNMAAVVRTIRALERKSNS